MVSRRFSVDMKAELEPEDWSLTKGIDQVETRDLDQHSQRDLIVRVWRIRKELRGTAGGSEWIV